MSLSWFNITTVSTCWTRFRQELVEEERQASAHKQCMPLASPFVSLLPGILVIWFIDLSVVGQWSVVALAITLLTPPLQKNDLIWWCSLPHASGTKRAWLSRYRILEKVQRELVRCQRRALLANRNEITCDSVTLDSWKWLLNHQVELQHPWCATYTRIRINVRWYPVGYRHYSVKE